jgi:hypothetical protein
MKGGTIGGIVRGEYQERCIPLPPPTSQKKITLLEGSFGSLRNLHCPSSPRKSPPVKAAKRPAGRGASLDRFYVRLWSTQRVLRGTRQNALKAA